MKLCVALDLPSREECVALAKELKGLDLWLKVGLRSFCRDGYGLVRELREGLGFKLFLDLKFYDIPNTMADAAYECAQMGVEMINLHASSGEVAMRAVMERLGALKSRPLVLAVTALTSFDDGGFGEIYNAPISTAAPKMAKMAHDCALDGVVCSVFESEAIKAVTADSFITLTPGIRPFGEDKSDQKRVADLNAALAAKSDYIVVGRPIYKAQNPRSVAEQILKNI